jgi:mannose-6-phosphate isomerase-like protein (cupin superfamily)
MARTATKTKPKPVEAGDESFAHGAFNIAKAAKAKWTVGLRDHFEYRDLGMTEATGGKLLAQVIRARRPCDEPGDEHYHILDFQMVYVLKGWARVRFEGIGERRLEAGDCMYQRPGIHHRVVEYADDFEVIEITVPADFETVSVAP